MKGFVRVPVEIKDMAVCFDDVGHKELIEFIVELDKGQQDWDFSVQLIKTLCASLMESANEGDSLIDILGF